ncbi:MAG TPA: hypothetical protein PLB68_05995 [Candidatus Aminicenantes bacterium]|nr:hypothetical protein [Candidatus Aminicenantes bacterium]HPB55490.1 hypothetical protein [Candidatus Aminicenantes bacterium]HPT00223.1 hypothetical protein [Candidatus Aminicenantes bacterium]
MREFFERASLWCQDRPRILRAALWLYFLWALVHHVQDPLYQSLFKPINLGIHELGHILFIPFGMTLEIFAGSFVQCVAPLIALLLFLRQEDYFAISVAIGWFSTNLYDVATYLGDARAQELPLVSPFAGEPLHDWNYLLGKWHLLDQDQAIASGIRFFAFLSMAAALLFGAWLLYEMSRKRPQQPQGRSFYR